VTVDGLNAACHNLTCEFEYKKNVGEITSFVYTEGTKQLVITGTALPTKVEDI
jgi:hypothetical protein